MTRCVQSATSGASFGWAGRGGRRGLESHSPSLTLWFSYQEL